MSHLSLWCVATLSISAMISVVNATGELSHSSRVLALTAALRLAMHAQLLLVRPLARARHVQGAQRHAGPRVQSGPPREKPLRFSTTRSEEWAARVAVPVWVVKCVPWERASA